uniref:Cytochrome P450 307a1 n=2 Tax=Cacopsylla melanoneura TaxID=428564 RepID=A0A8D8TKG2_9HEMI
MLLSIVLSAILLVTLFYFYFKFYFLVPKKFPISHLAPGPRPFPVIGNLACFRDCDTPFRVFTDLSKEYGDIYSLQMGTTPCIVVNSFELIKEILIVQGSIFGGRPDFIRYHRIFGNDRNNSMALCDWSSLQEKRRRIARKYCSPRIISSNYCLMSQISLIETPILLKAIHKRILTGNKSVQIKPLLQSAFANMFTQYLCSTRFDYEDKHLQTMVRNFDEIFYEINQGHPVDFLPWLNPFFTGHMNKIAGWANEIRTIMLERIIKEHLETVDYDDHPRDFVDALLQYFKEDNELSWDHIMYDLEDFIGGHAALGNLVMLILIYLMRNPHCIDRVRAEIDSVTGGHRDVCMDDKYRMPYTEALVFETLRICASPIVPHVATEDTSVAGYSVCKGTVVILNNFDLNTSDRYWDEPSQFKPERFISPDGVVIKPSHFIPFGTGKRTCIGQKLVTDFTFIVITSILNHYDVTYSNMDELTLVPACVALPAETYELEFTLRKELF